MMETWEEMTVRHKRERMELVQSLAQSHYTQTQAAKILDVKKTCLNNFIKRNKVHWPVIRQGRTKND
jgi:transcriptional regulator with GAF, ATPase, and Fis domain